MSSQSVKKLLLCVTFMAFTLCICEILHVDEPGCDCEECNESNVISLEETEVSTTPTDLFAEDTDGDGNRTICGRDRDRGDRIFASVCHMHCVNRCSQMSISKKNDTDKKVLSIYRSNYYKLNDGPCTSSVQNGDNF